MSNHVPDVLFGLSIHEKRDARDRGRAQREVQARKKAKLEKLKEDTAKRLKETNARAILVKPT
jgi:hypothetical protein